MNDEPQSASLEVLPPSALEAQERAQIDVQISTARRYPRVLSTVKKRMMEFATLDVETATSCFYVLPPRKGGDGKSIAGPSARLAEIALASYGHIKAAARIVGNDGKFITAQGVCHDLENNVSISVEVKRRITTKDGRTFGDDMQVVTGNAACSIALRNAIFKVVPMALIKPVYDAARKTAVGDQKTLATRRADALKHFVQLGVAKEKVLALVGAKALEDVTLENLESLIGFANAIKDGDSTIEEVFSPKAEAPLPSAGIAAALKPTPERVYTDAERETVIADLKNAMLDDGVNEKAAFEHINALGLVPEGIDDIWALPTAVLAQFAGKRTKKGGAK